MPGSPNAKSLAKTRLSGRLLINSQILVAGRDLCCSDSYATDTPEIAGTGSITGDLSSPLRAARGHRLLNPVIDVPLKRLEGHCTTGQNRVVECADVEAITEGFLGASP